MGGIFFESNEFYTPYDSLIILSKLPNRLPKSPLSFCVSLTKCAYLDMLISSKSKNFCYKIFLF